MFSPSAQGDRITYWVSPNGDDGWPGTAVAPFRTLKGARDAMRSLRAAYSTDSEFVIIVRDGTYRLEETLVLEQRDSGDNGHDVVYRAAPGANPVISGSIAVSNWEIHDPGLGIYRALAGRYSSRQLYVNGRRATRARTTPNPAGFAPLPIVMNGPPFSIGGGIAYAITELNPTGWRNPSTWTNPQAIEAVIVTQWKMMSVPLESIDPDPLLPGTGLITLQQPGWTNANVFFDKSTNAPGVWSFWQVTRYENAYEFLDVPGEWYLDKNTGWLYYIPLPGENLATAAVELPILEVLVDGRGELDRPVSNIRFEGLTFSYATWFEPSTGNGYVSDQSGFRLTGANHPSNFIGHDPDDVRTPGNVRFRFAQKITFRGNIFEHLGGVALDFDTGSQYNVIEKNLFVDISSAAIQLGGISNTDHHPKHLAQITRNNVISNNLIRQTGWEFVDAAAIYIGFTESTLISNNTIVDVPWAGIAVGWGWGLLDPGSYLGLPNAALDMWGFYDKPTPNRNSTILHNRIHSFLNVLWDGGAIYTTGQQGTSLDNGLLIMGNVATSKRPEGGGNTFYTDGGSRYITLKNNVSLDNPIGVMNFGPPPQISPWKPTPPWDPLPYNPIPSLANGLPYGGDTGGCRTYGDILFVNNYWRQAPIPRNEVIYNARLDPLLKFDAYSKQGYFNICPYSNGGTNYPTNLIYHKNTNILTRADVPAQILQNAGVRKRPANIPADKWILPPPP